MQFLDALAQNANPLFRPAVGDDVADVEMPADPRTVEFVHITRGLQRAEQKMVPDIFDGDLHAKFFGQRDGFADFLLRTLVGVGVGNLLVHHRRHKQNRTGAVTFGVAQRLLQTLQSLRAHFGVGVRHGFVPMRVATGAGGLEPGLLECFHHFVLVHVAHRLDPIEARRFDHLELFEHRPFHADRRVHDAFFDVPFLRNGVSGGQRG